MKTFTRQPGNKSRYLKFILPHIPKDYNTYYEPFVGTGALFLSLQPSKWIINDINDDLINLYIAVRDDLPNLLKSLKSFGTRTNFVNISNEDRLILLKKYIKKFTTLPYNTKRAVYYTILKFSAFKSIIIVNGKFQIAGLDPNWKKVGRKPYFLSEKYFEKLTNASVLLNTNGNIHTEDYKSILKITRKGDFCFIDSPYDEATDYHFTYNANQKNRTDFVDELYEELKKLDKKGVKWLMTQADTIQVKNRFKEYCIATFPVYRGLKYEYSTELLIKNY